MISTLKVVLSAITTAHTNFMLNRESTWKLNVNLSVLSKQLITIHCCQIKDRGTMMFFLVQKKEFQVQQIHYMKKRYECR